MLRAMRVIAILALLLATGVAACGGGDDTAAPTSWNGPERPYPENGVLPVEEFQAYAESVDEDWERDPQALAREYTRLQETGAESAPEEPKISLSELDGDTLTVTRDGLADDSVAAERYVLELEQDGDTWSLVSARWEQRCQAMRGHEEFGPGLCL
jgi:hypothetical protein